MTRSGAEISPVESSEELAQAWKEYGFDPPGGVDAWAEAVEADRNGVLVARLSAMAVGFVTVKWSGPSVREPEVTEALTTEFPDEQPIPTIYSLNVQQQHRRKGIGWDLMVATEHAIIDRPGTVLRSALSVQTNNKDALPLYISLGYQIVPYRGRKMVVLDRPEYDEQGQLVRSTKPVFIMTKDLSDLRKNRVK